ncbi:hypothetical protein HanXRQr2_Chr15g0678351 [Helianthus annuus]|uniref:Uncharacterized protein n=1 Tax=Helianthus annuus TaxID=4232 RepID=A0A9K3H1Y9_HELAN|nr:hypothetical protein HanXRQr2_Chr15g0678351 [Helianthus annuus]KAJ0830014.1 hypothetical protein HanPSC8_Chr15g0650371 [Helianthus annuus]
MIFTKSAQKLKCFQTACCQNSIADFGHCFGLFNIRIQQTCSNTKRNMFK